MGKAKTASKNNPLSRVSGKEIFYNNKKVVPVMYITDNRRYMAAQFEDGEMVTDAKGDPVAWVRVSY